MSRDNGLLSQLPSCSQVLNSTELFEGWGEPLALWQEPFEAKASGPGQQPRCQPGGPASLPFDPALRHVELPSKGIAVLEGDILFAERFIELYRGVLNTCLFCAGPARRLRQRYMVGWPRYCQMLWTDRPDQAASFPLASSFLLC
jgi:hypothetical protein